MTTMRAKLEIVNVKAFSDHTGEVTQERLVLRAVHAQTYPEDGSDEDNTFAKFTPSADLTMTIANPALLGKFKEGERFYVDFTPAPAE